MQTTNAHLWEELVKISQDDPLEGVLVNFPHCEKIIKELSDYGRHLKSANYLRKRYKESTQQLHLERDDFKFDE